MGAERAKRKLLWKKTRKFFGCLHKEVKRETFFETSIGCIRKKRSQEGERPTLLSEMPFRVTYSSMHRDAFIA